VVNKWNVLIRMTSRLVAPLCRKINF